MTLPRSLFALALAAVAAATALAGDVLTDYQARFTKPPYDSARAELVVEIAATGKPEAVKALQWCQAQAKLAAEDAREKSDKLQTKLIPIRAKYEQVFHEWVDGEKKKGNTPDVTRPPVFQEYDDFLKASAEVENAEKKVSLWEGLVQKILDLSGGVVAKLPADAQKAIADDWTKSRLGSKDWGVRSDLYQVLGHTPAPWALDMVVTAVGAEADPRALVVAIDALAGKDVAKAGPPLAARMDDARWLVRVAALQALEVTPSKEGIDAIVKRMVKEEGRLKDDCARVLRALTGQGIPPNPEMWRNWWAQNREKWTGKPPAAPPEGLPDPYATGKPKSDEDAKKTGFFGIQIESKRVVFVIDVSGSMTSVMGGSGPNSKETRAQAAKAELKRVVGALEDGALFNIVFYSFTVRIWKPDMQKADIKTRKEALDFVDAAEVAGGTNSYDALEAAFGLGDMGKGKKREADPTGDARVDTIVFLSDGKPSVGRITDPDEIRAAVKGWNKARRIAIHAVGFGTSSGSKDGHDGADPAFMKGLADDTGGQYVGK